MSVHYLPILNLKSKDFTVFLIPNEVLARYVAHLDMRGIEAAHQGQYKKWLRYYLDFCGQISDTGRSLRSRTAVL